MWPLQNLTFYVLVGEQSQGFKTEHPFTVLLSKYATVGNLYKTGILFMRRPPYQMPHCAIPSLLSYALLICVNKSANPQEQTATESFKSNSPSLPPAVIFPREILAKHNLQLQCKKFTFRHT